MEAKVLDAVKQFGLLQGAQSVTVALSGGADSMALLHLLLSLKVQFGISVSAAHFNHKIRGAEAESDEAFVKAQCEGLGVELFIGSADVPKYAKDNHLSLELVARQLRYEFFDTLKTDLIATAHTASDNLETVVFNLARGSSLKGLCGIPPKRDRIIRPLIFCSRQDVEDYCRDNNIEFVTDSTNLRDDYSRNNIRHNVIPALRAINPSLESAVVRNSAFLREDEEYLSLLAKKEFDARYSHNALDLKDFHLLAKPVAKRVIIMFYRSQCANEVDGYHINEIYRICMSGGKTSVGNNMSAIADGGTLTFKSNISEEKTLFEVELLQCENDLFENGKKVHNLLLKNSFDCDRIVGKLVVRTRLAGDKICLKNKNCTKTLKKLYTEYSVPVCEREGWPVIADDSGLVWVYGIGVAHRCAADEQSKRIYKVNVKKTKGICSYD